MGVCAAPQNVAVVEACGKAVGESCIVVTKDPHLGLEFPVSYSHILAVDDLEVGWWDEFGCFVGIIGCGVENEVTTCLVPFLVLVLLFCLFVLDEIQLLPVETIWCLASLWVPVILAARDRKMSEVLDRSPVGAVMVGGLICSVWRRRPKAASSPSSGLTEQRVSGTFAWWTPIHHITNNLM